MLICLQKYCIFRNYSPTTWFLLHIIMFMLFPIIMPKKKKQLRFVVTALLNVDQLGLEPRTSRL